MADSGKKPVVPVNCLFQGCYNPEYEKRIREGKDLCYKYNRLHPNDFDGQKEILLKLLGSMGKEVIITPPFWCDYGYNIHVGDYFYSNHNLIITDGTDVRFGDHVFIAPNCCFTTAEHPIDPEQRKKGLEIAKPITVGNNVWIGAGSTILAGASIGDNTVIGAGSVVKNSIPANVVAVGVPCRVMREITEEDKTRYPYYEGYIEKSPDKTEFHILNGDFALTLWEKSRSGANLVWKETYIEGPLPQTDDLHIFRNARSEYLATFAELENIGREKLYRHLQKMDDTILELPENTRLTLWFDSCIFDQTILMRILYLLDRRTAAMPEVLLYCCDGNCLTEKDFKEGQPLLLHSSDVKLGAKAWKTFVARDPEELRKLADTEDFRRLAALKKALLRCADEIPDQENLTRTQRQILQSLSQKSCSFVEIFQALDEFEEYPFLGDTACQRLLDDLVTKGRIRNVAPDLYGLPN